MRVLLTTDTIGGVWTFTKVLAAELLNLGHSVALISFGRVPSAAQAQWCYRTKAMYDNAFMYKSSLAPLEWMNGNTVTYSAALPELLCLIEQFRPDLIHTNQFCYGYLPLPVPTILTAHSDVVSWASACEPEGLKPSAWLHQYNFLVQRGLRAATAVTAPTEWMLMRLRDNFDFTMNARAIPNGRTLPQSAQLEERHYRVVTAGRLWDRAKNVKLLSRVRSPVPIFVAGSNIREYAASSEMPSQLRLLGDLDEVDLLSFFRYSSIYIVTSCYEPFGFAPLEAALCGCAILANDIPSLREVWGGFALYFRSAEELTWLLHELWESSYKLFCAQRRSFTRACQLTARDMTSSYLLLYENLIAASTEIYVRHAS